MQRNSSSARRGMIVNRNIDEKQLDEMLRFGEPSTVILLENIPTLDESVQRDVRDECSKHGYVQRVATRTSPTIGILVHFTGVAGAYKAVRALDTCVRSGIRAYSRQKLGGHALRARYHHADAQQ